MGAQVSSVANTTLNDLKSAITQTMEQKVDANVAVNCQNIQEVIGSTGCNITFGPQLCKAAGIADVTTDGNFAASATQDVFNSIEQKAKNSISGITIGAAVSNTSNFAKTVMDVSTTTVQSFNTNCSKNASALNRQMVKDCTDSTINFAAQSADVSVMGNCAANAAASTDSFNKLTNVVSQTAEAEIKGVDLMSMILMMLLPLLFFMIGPSLIRTVTSSWRNNDNSPETQKQAAASKLLSTLSMILVAYAALVWPGVGALVTHVYPWPPAIVNYKEDFCTDGQAGFAAGKTYHIDPRAFINNFVFYDKDCTLQAPGEPCEKAKHYKSCGIFSGLCDDPNAVADLEAYKAAFEACGTLSGFYVSS
jgi:hypothetical protein